MRVCKSVIILSIIAISCKNENKEQKHLITQPNISKSNPYSVKRSGYQYKINPENAPFTIQIETNKLGDDLLVLNAIITPDSTSYVTSAYDTEEAFPFSISIFDTGHIISIDPIEESPSADEEFDKFFNSWCKRARKKTTYSQNFKIISKGNFDVDGKIHFHIAPECVAFNIPFTLSYRSGVLEIHKSSITVNVEEQELIKRRQLKRQEAL